MREAELTADELMKGGCVHHENIQDESLAIGIAETVGWVAQTGRRVAYEVMRSELTLWKSMSANRAVSLITSTAISVSTCS